MLKTQKDLMTRVVHTHTGDVWEGFGDQIRDCERVRGGWWLCGCAAGKRRNCLWNGRDHGRVVKKDFVLLLLGCWKLEVCFCDRGKGGYGGRGSGV